MHDAWDIEFWDSIVGEAGFVDVRNDADDSIQPTVLS